MIRPAARTSASTRAGSTAMSSPVRSSVPATRMRPGSGVSTMRASWVMTGMAGGSGGAGSSTW
jgi:hypothetical protein